MREGIKNVLKSVHMVYGILKLYVIFKTNFRHCLEIMAKCQSTILNYLIHNGETPFSFRTIHILHSINQSDGPNRKSRIFDNGLRKLDSMSFFE